MEVLSIGLLQLGAEMRSLKAKLFGGADVLPFQGGISVGTRNARLATNWLSQNGIPVIAQRIGGIVGIQVRFQTGNGEAFARTLSR